MSLITLEVELDHGRVVSKNGEPLPSKAMALLTILPADDLGHDPFLPDSELQRVKFYRDPALPLDPEDWPEEAP